MDDHRLRRILLEDSSSDEEFEFLAILAIDEEEKATRRRSLGPLGSISGHAIIYRNRIEGDRRLYHDYFSDQCVYPPHIFRRRFRMNRDLFLRIQTTIEANDPYFVQRRDACGVLGLSSLQKITAAIRMLAYGVSADSVDDYVRIGETTAIESLKRFVKGVIVAFEDEYLRSPNEDDTRRLLQIGESRGFPGMLGSIDCMHWKWKNCPVAWQGMYSGHTHAPTVILEAVASYDLWIWHAMFGLPGSLNDINVLDRSTIFSELAQGRAPAVNYSINGHDYTMGYYLADGIYPKWATFVKTIPSPRGLKKQYFASCQESARKDIERAFGVLQSRWAIIRGPARLWDIETLKNIMKACIIMHNMIVENERDTEQNNHDYEQHESTPREGSYDRCLELYEFIQSHHRIRDREIHCQLQDDLVEHCWQRHGGD